MASLNKVILIGNLTRDPELRYTPSGTAVANFRLAVNRRYTVNGEKREEVLYIDCVAWGKTGEITNEYTKKGSPVCVEGRLQSREWEAKDGQKRVTVEVNVENIQFLAGAGGGQAGGQEGRRDDRRDARPEQRGGVIDAPDDDVPF